MANRMISRADVLLIIPALCMAVPIASDASGKSISRDFSVSAKELKGMTAMLPRDLQVRIQAEPERFLSQVARVFDQPADLFVLVDKKHLLPVGYTPPDLALLKDYALTEHVALVTTNSLQVRKVIVPELLQMVKAARAEGITLVFSSTYRSYSYQVAVYDREVKTYGQEAADRESARPGTSQHQLGPPSTSGPSATLFPVPVRANGSPPTPRSTAFPFPSLKGTRR